MNSQRSPLRFAFPPSRFPRSFAVIALALTGGVSLLAVADGMTQPDPPVPIDGPAQKIALAQRDAPRDLDCRCAVLHARDIESRVEGHVERFEALSSAPAAKPTERALTARHARHLHLATYVEGVVGFPVRDFRLAADPDDAAGSD